MKEKEIKILKDLQTDKKFYTNVLSEESLKEIIKIEQKKKKNKN